MTMDCTEAKAHLPLFVGGDLEAPHAAQVDAHVAVCQACEARLFAAREARGALLEWARVESDESDVDLWPGVRAGLAREGLIDALPGAAESSPTLGRVLTFARYFGGAAAAAVLALMVWKPWAGELPGEADDSVRPLGAATASVSGAGVEAPLVRGASAAPVSWDDLVGSGLARTASTSQGGGAARPLMNQPAVLRGSGAGAPGLASGSGGLRRIGPRDSLLRDGARPYPEGSVLVLPRYRPNPSGFSLASDAEIQ